MAQTKNRGCGHKKGHVEEAGAVAQIARLQRRFGVARGTYEPYRCRHCGQWHIGHRSRRR
jgi:hypothetical protein